MKTQLEKKKHKILPLMRTTNGEDEKEKLKHENKKLEDRK